MKKIAYVGPEGGGVTLENGPRMPHGQTVEIADAVHAELLTNRPEEFENRETVAAKAGKKDKGGEA